MNTNPEWEENKPEELEPDQVTESDSPEVETSQPTHAVQEERGGADYPRDPDWWPLIINGG